MARHVFRLTIAACAAAALVVGPLSPQATASPAAGELDPTFASGGIVVDWGASYATGGAAPGSAVRDKSGRLVVAARDGIGGLMVLRYLADGSRDMSFDGDGIAQVEPWTPAGGLDNPGITIDGQGRILIVGSVYDNSTIKAGLARLLPTGAADPTLCGTGRCTFVIGSTRTDPVGVAVQPSGKIVIGGSVDQTSMFVARYTSAGAPDGAFGDSGVKEINVNKQTLMREMTMLPDGRILAVGSEWDSGFSAFALVRWTVDGQFDTSFGGTGAQITFVGTAVHDEAEGVALLPNGQFLVAGYGTWANPDSVLLRYNADGSLDTNWAVGGVESLNRSDYNESWYSVAVQRDGKIVLGGFYRPSGRSDYDFSIARLTAAGDLDTSYNGTGLQAFDFAQVYDVVEQVLVDRAGRTIAIGTSQQAPAIVALIGDATAPGVPSFAALPMFSLVGKQRVRWTATDDNTGVKSYDVQEQTGGYTSSKLSTWKTVRSGTTTPYVDVKRSPGKMFCFRVRARDWAGNVGAYSSPHCTTFPVDDRTLSVHGTWSSPTGASYYLGTARRSSVAKSSLTLQASYRQLALLASTCPTCGKVKVYRGTTLLGTISLHSTTAHSKVLLPLPFASTVRTGTLRIVQVTGGHPVVIDGLGVTLDASA